MLPIRFCSNSVSPFSKFDEFLGISPIMVVILSISEWSLYLELFFRAHRIHVSYPCCKKIARQKFDCFETGRSVGLFSAPRCPNHLQFARIQNEWHEVPKNFINLPSDSFLIRAAAEEDWKLRWILVFQKISLTFIFFSFFHPRFQ